VYISLLGTSVTSRVHVHGIRFFIASGDEREERRLSEIRRGSDTLQGL